MIHAIKKLDVTKACGSDGVYSVHIKYASNIFVPMLSMCFTSCTGHGFLPDSMLSVVLVPVIKDKISSKDNYHPIALANVFSKLIEIIILDRTEMYRGNVNVHLINHIMCADDLILISPSSAGLCQLLYECQKF